MFLTPLMCLTSGLDIFSYTVMVHAASIQGNQGFRILRKKLRDNTGSSSVWKTDLILLY